MKKACFIASSGGHWEELMCLKDIADEYDTFFVTEEGGQANDSNLKNIYTLPQINRHEKNFAIHFAKMFGKVVKILRKEKPDFIITTGALIAFPFCILGKLRGTKIIYIEDKVLLRKYISELTTDLASFGVPERQKRKD